MLPGSYARLAGHQSETNKFTITRVANSEVQYRRKIDCYRKDMDVKISGIKREQVRLRRSMLRYRKMIRQHKLQKREAMRLEKEELTSSRVNILIVNSEEGKMEDIEEEEEVEEEKEADTADIETVKVQDGGFKENEECIENTVCCNAVGKQDNQMGVANTDLKSGNTPDSPENDEHTFDKQVQKQRTSSVSFGSVTTLPTITEADERCTVDPKLREEDVLRTDDQFRFSSHLQRKKKKTKSNVSYSDLIKLQHNSSNTKILFKLVDDLAFKNGIQEKRRKIPDIRDNVHFRGESPALASSITKRATVFYPIKFGYAAGSDTFPDRLITEHENSTDSRPLHLQAVNKDNSHYDRISSEHVDGQLHCNSYDRKDTQRVSQSQPKRKPSLSLPSLVQEVTRIKSEQGCKQPKNHKCQSPNERISVDQSSSRKTATSRSLPPIERSKTRFGVDDKENSNKVEWQAALAKMKTVHTLVNFSWMF